MPLEHTSLGKAPAVNFHTSVGGNKSAVLPNDRFDVMLDAETSGTADPTAAYSFSLASDQAVFLDLTATSGDGSWALIGPNGAEIDRRNANNTGADLGRFELLAGDYQVRFDGAGTHSFVVRASVDTTTVLPLGSFVDDAFAFAGDRLTLVVPVPVDTSAYFRRLGAQVDVRVLDPVGRVVLDVLCRLALFLSCFIGQNVSSLRFERQAPCKMSLSLARLVQNVSKYVSKYSSLVCNMT